MNAMDIDMDKLRDSIEIPELPEYLVTAIQEGFRMVGKINEMVELLDEDADNQATVYGAILGHMMLYASKSIEEDQVSKGVASGLLHYLDQVEEMNERGGIPAAVQIGWVVSGAGDSISEYISVRVLSTMIDELGPPDQYMGHADTFVQSMVGYLVALANLGPKQ